MLCDVDSNKSFVSSSVEMDLVTPKHITKVMNHKLKDSGIQLTRLQVASHLQQHRMRVRNTTNVQRETTRSGSSSAPIEQLLELCQETESDCTWRSIRSFPSSTLFLLRLRLLMRVVTLW